MPESKKGQNYQFVVMILIFISFIYFVTFKLVLIDHYSDRVWFYPYTLLFNLLFFMLMWSLIKTMKSDPGRVPHFWGYYIEKADFKKRRYCLICHIFKPERCHHCSACNRCVLNMDHHCPWISNCVGFENRKFFILMLTYIVVADFVALIPMTACTISQIEQIDQYFENEVQSVAWIETFFILVAQILALAAFVVIGNFYKFHIQLVIKNSSTIENLDKQRNSNKQQANYDMGVYYNFVQVFGKNKLLWPFPMFLDSGKPVGDGIVWPQKYQYSDEEKDQQLQSVQKNSQVSGLQSNIQNNNQYNSEFNNTDSKLYDTQQRQFNGNMSNIQQQQGGYQPINGNGYNGSYSNGNMSQNQNFQNSNIGLSNNNPQLDQWK